MAIPGRSYGRRARIAAALPATADGSADAALPAVTAISAVGATDRATTAVLAITASIATSSTSTGTVALGVAASTASAGATAAATTTSRAVTVTVIASGMVARFAAASLAATATVQALSVHARFVTAISGAGRYFIDQSGEPIWVHADTPWSLVLDLNPAEQVTYFANREANGFNAVGLSLTGSTGTGGPSDDSAMYDGVKPFTSDNITTPNSTYWARVDAMLDLAASHGITVFAYAPDTFGYQSFFQAATLAQCEDFGEWLGARYGDRPNLLWMAGGDYDQVFGQADEEIAAIHDGIKTTAPDALWAMNWNYYQSISTDLDSSPGGSLPSSWARDRSDYQWVYSYSAAYDKIRDAYSFGARPVIFGEGRYEDNNTPGWVSPQTPEGIRRQYLWTLTSGGVGHWYGREGVWQFETTPVHWATRLDSTSVSQLHSLRTWLEELAWWTLIPDLSNTFLTSGQGTPTSHGPDTINDPLNDQYVTAAKAVDNTLAIVYVPAASGSRTITVDKDQITSPRTALWVDPSNPAATSTAVFSGDNVTTPAGANGGGGNDWLLLLESMPARDATRSVTATITASGVAGGSSGASLAAAVSIPASGSVGRSATTAPTVSAALFVSGNTGLAGAATESVTGVIASAGSTGVAGPASLATAVSIAAVGVLAAGGSASQTLGTAIISVGARGVEAAAALANTATITAAGTAVSGLSATASVAVTATTTSAHTATTGSAGALAASVGVTASGSVSGTAEASLAATASVTAAGSLGLSVGVALAATVAVAPVGATGVSHTTVLAVVATIAAAGSATTDVAAHATTTATITASGAISGFVSDASLLAAATILSMGALTGGQSPVVRTIVATITASGFARDPRVFVGPIVTVGRPVHGGPTVGRPYITSEGPGS